MPYLTPTKLILSTLTLSIALSGCAPLLIGGAAVGGAASITDRRTLGSQVDDKAIELKTESAINKAHGDKVHINVNAFNRHVLLTGEAPSAEIVSDLTTITRSIENVKEVFNEVAVAGLSSLTQRTQDTYITGKVKAAILGHKQLSVNTISVTTERSIVYLMGRVTQQEANLASQVAAGISGVVQVVNVFQIMSEEELLELKANSLSQ